MIDWGKYFDRVYCVHCTTQEFKLPRLMDELSRVGLLISPVFEMRYTSPSVWDEVIRQAEPDPVISAGVVNLGLETIRLLRESLARGFRRILVIENDVAFLKDLSALEKSLDEMPDRDIVQFDYFFCWNDPWRSECETRRRDFPIGDGTYFDPGHTIFYSGSGLAYSRRGMAAMADFLEPRPTAPDGEAHKLDVTRAIARTPLAVQTVYSGCITENVGSHHKGYELAGLDYSRYNFPAGYGRGSYINSKTGELMNTAGKSKLFISVYAITKNESKFVDRWMDSMQEADEVVVLDTGSIDDTVGKLRARGAKVEVREFKPWRFDTSRNASMELCSPEADLLVCTDLDEVLNKGWRDALEKAWLKAKAEGRDPTTATYWYTWNFTPDGRPDRRFIYEKVHKPGVCKWTHPVHEILSYDGRKETVFVEGMELEHHPDNGKSRDSYLGLLEMSVEEDPEDDRNMHYLGREYMFKGMWQKAVDTLQRHLSLPRAQWRAERAASMRFMGRCYAAMGKDLTAELWYRRACDEEPDVREPAVEFAQFLYDRKAPWTQLRAACERALRVTERAGSYLTEAEAWGSKPHDLLSVALWNLGDFKGALKAAEKALELEPGNERIQKNVENIRKAATK